jgi:O-acetyl-ADP-ribose deacetylase (regulator of RNase III)
MGAGIALAIKNTFPNVYQEYVKVKFRPGDIQLVAIKDSSWITNLASQDYTGGHHPTSYDALYKGFRFLRQTTIDYKIESIHLPLIGCGIGGGSVGVMLNILEEVIDDSVEKFLWIDNDRDMEKVNKVIKGLEINFIEQ